MESDLGPRLPRFPGSPHLLALATDLARGDHRSTAAYLDSLASPDQVHSVLTSLRDDLIPAHEAWLAAEPDSARVWTISGLALIGAAWQARSSQAPGGVTDTQPSEFDRLLGLAEARLVRAAELDPADPLPICQLITVGMGQGVALSELRARFMAAEQRRPNTVVNYTTMVGPLAARWGGSHEEMFEFARWAHATLPDGNLGRMALVQAHFERWLCHDRFDKDGGGPGYYRQPAVIEEIVDVERHTLASPDQTPGVGSTATLNSFAFCYRMADRRSDAARLFPAIGSEGSAAVWGYLGQSGLEFERARAWAMGQ